MRFLLLLLLTCLSFHSQAQTPADTSSEIDIVFIATMAKFPGGDTAFAAFIKDNLVYPEDARMQGITGVTYIQFIVEIDGSLSNIQAVEGKGLYPSCDQAAIDVLKKSPRWEPALKDGVPTKIKMIQRFNFKLVHGKQMKKRK